MEIIAEPPGERSAGSLVCLRVQQAMGGQMLTPGACGDCKRPAIFFMKDQSRLSSGVNSVSENKFKTMMNVLERFGRPVAAGPADPDGARRE
jgi:hypothetical protein